MNRGKLSFTISPPRGGKSTYCEKWVDEPISDGWDRFCSGNWRRAIVSSDNIRMALNGVRYEPLAETMVFAIKHVMIRALLDRGFDVIVDGTHSTKISIQRLLEIDPNATPIFIDTPVEECNRRAIETGKPDLIPVIARIDGNINKIKEIGFEIFIKEIVEEINKRGLYQTTRSK